MIAKRFEMADKRDKKEGNLDKFDQTTMDEALNKVCKTRFDNLKSIDQIEKYTAQMNK